MDLKLPEAPGHLKSKSQIARVITEQWALQNLYCPACPSDEFRPEKNNNEVHDFVCGQCALKVSLKSQSRSFGAQFLNSAYRPKIEAIRDRRLPDYALLTWDVPSWSVTNVVFLPGYFIPEHHVVRRNPLGPKAKRAGHVGSYVVLKGLPPDAFVHSVESSLPRKPEVVRTQYARFEWLKKRNADAAGWTADVLREVRRFAPLRGMTFTTKEFYAAAEPLLAAAHPNNHNVKAKIRQQLQLLRDRGIVAFEGRGTYRVLA